MEPKHDGSGTWVSDKEYWEDPVAASPPRSEPSGWRVWGQDGELAFEYIQGERHVIVTVERDGLGYAIRRGDRFESGKFTIDAPDKIAAEINAAIATINGELTAAKEVK